MSEQQYNIIFRGDIVFGFQLTDVKLRLQQLFKTDEAKINALFSGRPVVVKRNLDLPNAEKYRAALLQAGAQVEIVAADDSAACKSPTVIAPPVAAPADLPVAAKGPQLGESWSLAPVGEDLLRVTERAAFVARTIETRNFGLRPAGGDLLEASERRPVSQAQVMAPNFEVAKVGADLLRDDEKITRPAAAIVEPQWHLADLGADLIRDEERDIVPHAFISLPEVGLAPVGADLGQLKPEIKPVVVDINGIQLLD